MKEMERYKIMCAEKFSTHKATIITETDRYFILDWRREDGAETGTSTGFNMAMEQLGR